MIKTAKGTTKVLEGEAEADSTTTITELDVKYVKRLDTQPVNVTSDMTRTSLRANQTTIIKDTLMQTWLKKI